MSAFGTQFVPEMALTTFDGQQWSDPSLVPSNSIVLHPGAHVLHYASTCFEGLKAFTHPDGSRHIFRMDQNIARLAQSSRLLSLPEVDEAMLRKMILDLVIRYKDEVPAPPGTLYLRPTHIGTEAAIGKAAARATESILYVLGSPVGDYFAGGDATLRILIDEVGMRCAPHMGMVKSGGNYASALQMLNKARVEHKADQVLFCPDGDVQETAAANFMLIEGNELVTKALDSTFLHGVTRASVLTLAAEMGLTVSERNLSVAELIERSAQPGAEAALSGTAAVLTPVGTLIYQGKDYTLGAGKPGPITIKLRKALNDIQFGMAEDRFDWLTPV
ncbi:branched-chain amino acid aminotransferase [Oceanospirillaceae bacterium]|nr:branched-chain amino acid aminotransferase [Oceanospirillaceae bacterium]MDC1351738.1 branched-chain amino acid aminotransferase [Oceanospirillaceae bacterium]MDC1507709.1 branched-chain amino acid aminotransferase [Oceanospirillaceae bacterium]MDO7573364.1 branched-chain amino acid aminotransferase [Oceanospirillaceae bacterium]MDO7586049.1 branched-chain amino acid aminotransferase [Oceanospirillaceae bacterium]